MLLAGHEIKIKEAIENINNNNYKTVVLQFPEGLKIFAIEIYEALKKETDAEFIISMDPCYGACDLVDNFYPAGDIDAVFHFGHETMNFSVSVPTYFIKVIKGIDLMIFSKAFNDFIENVDIKKIKRNDTCEVNEKLSIGLITTSQHIESLKEISEIINNYGHKTFYNGTGQILGCDFTNALMIKDKVDIYLFIGSGNFHPVGLSMLTDKTVYCFDPYTSEITDTTKEKEKFLRRRYGSISSAMDFKTAGIIVSTKRGQYKLSEALDIKSEIEKSGKKAFIFTMHNITDISYVPVDILVMTACPRIPVDDSVRYSKPVITTGELRMILDNDLERYRMV